MRKHDLYDKTTICLRDNLGLSGTALTWMNSYLRGRSQSVVINATKSEPADLQYGVPRESALGPYFSQYTHHQLELLLSVKFLRYTSTRMTQKYIGPIYI